MKMAESTSNNQSKLSEAKFHNWIKSGLAVMYTKKGLQPFVIDEITIIQKKTLNSILTSLSLKTDMKCSACPTDVIVCDKVFENCKRKICSSYHRLCPEGGLCDQFKQYIIKAHRYHGPSWLNTNARLWCSDPWQVAKCYMPREGYSTQMTADETDFNGIVSVILNHQDFSKTLGANLTDTENIFLKARDISKLVRHSALYEVADDGFDDNLGILTKVLEVKQIAKYKEAQDAMQKLSQLKKSKWSILTSMNDIFEVIKTACTNDDASPKTPEEKEKIELLKIAVKIIEEKTSTDVKSVVNKLQASVEKHDMEKIKRKEVCRRLIKSYQLECSSLPISALFEEEDAPLLSFYAQPMMQQVEYHNIGKQFTSVKSYYDIFNKDGKLCRNIYITGDAGSGKTAVCQRMVLCWCHAMQEGAENLTFSQKDVDAMRAFDFLFFVSLRDTEDCRVAEMIKQQLLDEEEAKLLNHILDKESCLIILDGFDEWSHPKSTASCPGIYKVPHRKAHDNCVYLTTSRPWKLEVYRLKTTEIDQQIELKGLDKAASSKLTSAVVDHLNKKYLNEMDPKDFERSIEKNEKIESISNIPIIKIQLISLWFKDTKMKTSYSRCSIYGQTVNMLFTRAKEREENQFSESPVSSTAKRNNEDQLELDAPACLSEMTCFEEYSNLIYKSGHLAFHMLFETPDDVSALVFKRNIGNKFGFSDKEMDFLLSVGILSKNKHVTKEQERMMKLTFLHKSYQEFFAAFYITMNKDIESIQQSIFSKCKTLSEFLRYEQLFVFMSGMKVKVMEKISTKVRDMVSHDKNVNAYRQSAHYKFGVVVWLKPYNNLANVHFDQERNGKGALSALQTLLLDCSKENKTAGVSQNALNLPLSDIFIENSNTQNLTTLLKSNIPYIRSVSTEVYLDEFSSLEKLEKLVVHENTYPECKSTELKLYERCISSSSNSMVSLSLANCQINLSLSAHGLEKLSSLAVFDVVLEHKYIDDLFSFISEKVALTHLYLCGVKCSDHGDACKGSKLDLRSHEELKHLRFQDLYAHGAHQTRLNNKNLQTLVIDDDKVDKNILHDIRSAAELTEVVFAGFETLHMIDNIVEIVPTFPCLETLSFFYVEFGDRLLQLNNTNKQPIKMVSFMHASLTLDSFSRFVDSLPNKGVIVHLKVCRIISSKASNTREKEMEVAAKYVRSKETFEVTHSDKSTLAFNSKDMA